MSNFENTSYNRSPLLLRASHQMLQFPPAQRRLLHQDGVGQQVERRLHVGQNVLQRSHVPPAGDGGQGVLHVLRPVDLGGQNHQLGLNAEEAEFSGHVDTLQTLAVSQRTAHLVAVDPVDVGAQVDAGALVEGGHLSDGLGQQFGQRHAHLTLHQRQPLVDLRMLRDGHWGFIEHLKTTAQQNLNRTELNNDCLYS